jgi:hypothetical protein
MQQEQPILADSALHEAGLTSAGTTSCIAAVEISGAILPGAQVPYLSSLKRLPIPFGQPDDSLQKDEQINDAWSTRPPRNSVESDMIDLGSCIDFSFLGGS